MSRRNSFRHLLRTPLHIGGHNFSSVAVVWIVLMVGMGLAVGIFGPCLTRPQVSIDARGFGLIDTYIVVAATLLGALFMVSVYQFTVLRPELPAEGISTKKLRHLTELSDFAFWQALVVACFYIYSIAIVMSVRILGGFNDASLRAAAACWVVGSSCYACIDRLRVFWRPHKTRGLKLAVVFFASAALTLQLPLFLFANAVAGLVEPYVPLLILNCLVLLFATVSLLTNLSYPFVVSLDAHLYGSEIAQLNRLLARAQVEDGDVQDTVSRLARRWDMFKDDMTGHTEHLDIRALRQDMNAIARVLNEAAHRRTAERKRDKC